MYRGRHATTAYKQRINTLIAAVAEFFVFFFISNIEKGEQANTQDIQRFQSISINPWLALALAWQHV